MMLTREEMEEMYPEQLLALHPPYLEDDDVNDISEEVEEIVCTGEERIRIFEKLLAEIPSPLGAYSTLPEGMKIPKPVILSE